MKAESITSTRNEYIKKLRKLQQKKEREAEGLFLAEGILCAGEAMQYADVEALLLTEKYMDSDAAKMAEEKNIRILLVSDAVMEAVSSAKNPQGALAVVKKQQQDYKKEGLILVLEDVSDPQNVGTMIRTADAMGASAVLLSKNAADCYSPACVRATMGSVFHIPILYLDDLYAELSALKNAGIPLVAGHLKGKSSLPVLNNAAIMIGNETRGLSDRISEMADVLYRIPMFGRAESLNAAIAAGIMMQKASEMIFAEKMN